MDAKDKIIADLQAENATLRAELKAARELIAQLQQQVAELQEEIAKLKKNSQTSHKPPSSDIVKPPKKKKTGKRKIGAQKGHPQHSRKPFPPEQVDTFITSNQVRKSNITASYYIINR